MYTSLNTLRLGALPAKPASLLLPFRSPLFGVAYSSCFMLSSFFRGYRNSFLLTENEIFVHAAFCDALGSRHESPDDVGFASFFQVFMAHNFQKHFDVNSDYERIG